jgi:dipeptidyl aminopeptidase/acylaminoacyl peptidase
MRPVTLFLAATALFGIAACDRTDTATTAEVSVETAADADNEAATNVPEYSIDQFLETVAHGGLSFSPDNSKVLVHSNETGIFNLFALSTDGRTREQLTHSTTDSIRSAGYFPRDERALYLADEGGNELYHVYVREIDGSVRDLTPGQGHRAEPAGWTYDLSRFLILTNERDERFMDLYAYDPEDYSREMIYSNDEGFVFGGMSPDERFLALARAVTNVDMDIYLHDLQTGETTLVTDDAEPVANAPAGFAPDGRLIYLTDRDSEFQFAVARDIESGDESILAEPNWDVASAAFSYRGRYLAVSVNADAQTELTLLDTQTGEEVDLPSVPNASVQGVRISRDETTLGMYAASSRMPGDLFVQSLSGGEPRQLTRSLAVSIDPAHLVDGEVVRFASFDGLEIPGVLYMPHEASPESKVPALVWVHGGPGGQSRVGYADVIQYMVNHGYAVFAINNRGSSGYGKTFYRLDDQAHGEGDLDDCVASRQMLIDTGLVDPDRIGIIGGSYGGYMVLAAQTFRPGAFKVGVDIFGISNWYRTVQSIPPWWEAQREALAMEMGDFDDEAYFRSISPLFHAENIVSPLLVIQGANDPRVLQIESDEIVAAARANGVEVEYIVFDDEGHGFSKKENQSVAYSAIVEFLDRFL